jgi:hypothetical protein
MSLVFLLFFLTFGDGTEIETECEREEDRASFLQVVIIVVSFIELGIDIAMQNQYIND